MKLICSTVTVLCFALLLASCSKTNKEGRYIPKNASFAMIIHTESLSAKLPWEEIKKNELFKKLYSDTSVEAYAKSVLDNPENMGIDMKNDLIVFVVKDSLGGYSGLQGTVKDEAKFRQFNINMLKGTDSEKDGIHYISNEKMMTSWKKDKFVILTNTPDAVRDAEMISTKRDLTPQVNAIYALSEDNSLGKDEKFTDLLKTKADMHFWASIGAFAADSKEVAAMAMMNLGKLYQDSYYAGAANFDNGKITVDLRSYSGKEMTELNKKYSGAKMNTAMISRIPTKDVAMLVALSFKPEGLREFVKLLGVEGFINMGSSQLGFTFDDFIKANKGDIAFALSSLGQDSAGTPKVSAVFGASIADRNAFGKLIEAGNKGLGSAAGGIPKLYSKSSNDFFALGTEEADVNKFISSENNSKFDFVDKASGESSLFYMNIPRMLNMFTNKVTRDSLENMAMEVTSKMWDNVMISGGGFDDGATKMHAEINLLDKNTNSLKQLNDYLGRMAAIQQQIKMKRDKWMDKAMLENQIDSSMSPVLESPGN